MSPRKWRKAARELKKRWEIKSSAEQVLGTIQDLALQSDCTLTDNRHTFRNIELLELGI